MPLDKKVRISNEFIRSINLVDDQDNEEILKNLILTHSSEKALLSLLEHSSTGKQSSFTWTGPYGSGKSVLALFLAYLSNPDNKCHDKELSKIVSISDEAKLFFSKKRKIIPVIGSSKTIVQCLGEKLKCDCDADSVLNKIKKLASSNKETIIIVDEMGKFLEYALINKETDIYIFQQIAEIVNRSSGKLIFIGILHQSFQEYTRNQTKSIRDEWAKIQGRYIDFSINAVGEEQIELISRAINSDLKPTRISAATKAVTEIISKNKPTDKCNLNKILNSCWPLHPLVAGLLGPISRKRFGQNQRSIFSFLSSAELYGFNHFISTNTISSKSVYSPVQLWDYLQSNFENAIIASPDSSLWNLATESIGRASVTFNTQIHTDVLKVISLINIFKGNSGIDSTKPVLLSIFDDKVELEAALKSLIDCKILKIDEFKSRYSLFEGSDFDLDAELEIAGTYVVGLDFDKLNQIADFNPIVAKRFYHLTGSLRWMNIKFVNDLSSCKDQPANLMPDFSIIVPNGESDHEEILQSVQKVSLEVPLSPIAITPHSKELRDISIELISLEYIQKNSQALSGDKIARKEIESKISLRKNQLNKLAESSLINSDWYFEGSNHGRLSSSDINSLSSNIAEKTFPKVPKIKSEIINKDKPSSSANAGLNILLKRMVFNEGEENLGIEGYPLEMGLFKILLEDTGIYGKSGDSYSFRDTTSEDIKIVWDDFDKTLRENNDRTLLTDIYSKWCLPPFGIKRGLNSFICLSYLIARSDNVAVYLNDTYVPQIDDLVVDYLIRSPKDISLKFIESTNENRQLLEDIHQILIKNKITSIGKEEATAFNLAKALVQKTESLNPWVLKTRRFDRATTQLRESIKKANDPNKLIYTDIKNLFFKDSVDGTKHFENSLIQITEAYDLLIKEIGQKILGELNVKFAFPKEIKNLKDRAAKIKGMSGDFRVDALSSRLSSFQGNSDDIAGIASLAANKSITDWIDLDIERALIEISVLCEGMKKAEIYANVKGERKRHSFSYASSLTDSNDVESVAFDVMEDERPIIEKTKKELVKILKASDTRLALAALAEIGNEKAKELNER